MFYLRNVKSGVEINTPLGEEYVKVDITKLDRSSEMGRLFISYLLQADTMDLPDSNLFIFKKGDVTFPDEEHALDADGSRHYIVNSEGNTYEVLNPEHMESEDWAKLIDKYDAMTKKYNK